MSLSELQKSPCHRTRSSPTSLIDCRWREELFLGRALVQPKMVVVLWGIFWDSIQQFMVVLWDLMAGWW